MDEEYLISTIRYVELNPVTAGLCVNPEDGKWSSASAHINGVDDTLVSVRPMLNRIDDWAGYLSMNEFGTNAEAEIEKHTRTGRPLGEQPFNK